MSKFCRLNLVRTGCLHRWSWVIVLFLFLVSAKALGQLNQYLRPFFQTDIFDPLLKSYSTATLQATIFDKQAVIEDVLSGRTSLAADLMQLIRDANRDVKQVRQERYPHALAQDAATFDNTFLEGILRRRVIGRTVSTAGDLVVSPTGTRSAQTMPSQLFGDPDNPTRNKIIDRFNSALEAVAAGKGTPIEINSIAEELLLDNGTKFLPPKDMNSPDAKFTILPEGDTFVNQRAEMVKTRLGGVTIIFNPWKLIQKSNAGYFSLGTNELATSIASVLYDHDSETVPHEMLHAYFTYLAKTGLESPYNAVLRRQTQGVTADLGASYDQFMSLEELATQTRDLEVSLRRAKKATSYEEKMRYLNKAASKAYGLKSITINTLMTLREMTNTVSDPAVSRSNYSAAQKYDGTDVAINSPGGQTLVISFVNRTFANAAERDQTVKGNRTRPLRVLLRGLMRLCSWSLHLVSGIVSKVEYSLREKRIYYTSTSSTGRLTRITHGKVKANSVPNNRTPVEASPMMLCLPGKRTNFVLQLGARGGIPLESLGR